MTINGTWGYNKNDLQYKSTTQLIRALIDAASKGGNFLLNVGPTPEGTIQPEFEERLRAMGKWLKVNGDSIYGTTYGPLQRCLRSHDGQGQDALPARLRHAAGGVRAEMVAGKVVAAGALSGGRPVRFTQSAGGVRLDLTGHTAAEHATVFAIRMK